MSVKAISWLKYVAVFAVVFFGAFLIFIQLLVSEKKEVLIPQLQDLSWAQASEKLDALGLVGKIQDKKFHFFKKENVVLSQSVAPNETVMEGREILFDLSKGRNPLWKDQLIGKPWPIAQRYLKDQGVTFYQKFHICTKNPSMKVQDVSWLSDQKQMQILMEDKKCKEPWVLKRFDRARYMQSFRKEINQKGMDLRMIGAYKDFDHVFTDPSAGSVVEEGDYIIIRKQ